MDLVAGPLGSLISKLGELLKEEYDLQTGLREKITCLSRDLESMHAVLRKVAAVPPEQLDDDVKLWARDVRELSYDAEDVLDRFLLRVEGPKARDQTWLKRVAEMIRKIKDRSKIGSMIKIINEQADAVAERHRRYRAEDIVSRPATTSTVDPRLEAMYKEVTQLIGIDEPRDKLKSMLSSSSNKKRKIVSSSSNKNMKVVSVVGAGGLGKTTLAKAVYDELISGYDCGAFVSVGRSPDLIKVLRDILINLDKKYMQWPNLAMLDERQLIDELLEYLESKRYLIVVDDIWETESWGTIKLALVQNNSGSRLITTTRKLDVAKEADEFYELQPLPCEKARKLFYTRIFDAEGKCPDNQLDEVSTKILKKCGGVPLAIITMASLLAGKSRAEWIEVCSSIAFRDKDNKQVSDTEWILSLSYYDLPPHLKTCLLYLSVFPEDRIINKHSLIWKWVAEGFVHKKEGTRFFEAAERYFNELINRSMIQAVKLGETDWEVDSGEYGMVVGCRVHDMVLDLLRLKSQEENFVTVSSNGEDMLSTISSRVRRLAHQNRMLEKSGEDHHKDQGILRSLIAYRCDVKGLSLPRFELLRVLALESCNGNIRLEHLGSLLHLRYLGLRGTYIDKLPAEIGSLKFLQALELGSASDQMLPSSIGILTQLIYLKAQYFWASGGVIEKLMSLEELHLKIGDMAQFARELGKLSELRVLNARINNPRSTGESFNRYLVESTSESFNRDLVESIGKLHKIRHLQLSGINMSAASLWERGVLSRHLQHLIVPYTIFCNGSTLSSQPPSSVMPACINPSDLPNLTHLDLCVAAMEDQDLKILGQLPELRNLKLRIIQDDEVKVTVTSTTADCFFQKLRYCCLNHSTVQFVLNEDSSVTCAIWNRIAGANMASGFEKREDCGVAAAFMPNLEVLVFGVYVDHWIHMICSPNNLGLEYLPSLQKVIVRLCWSTSEAMEDAYVAVSCAVKKAIGVHPNRPTISVH